MQTFPVKVVKVTRQTAILTVEACNARQAYGRAMVGVKKLVEDGQCPFEKEVPVIEYEVESNA